MNEKSIIELAGGAVLERIDSEMARVMANIMDFQTDPKKARTITVKVSLKPKYQLRRDIIVDFEVSSKLAPREALTTVLETETDEATGLWRAVEKSGGLPGQMRMDETEEAVQAVRMRLD